MDAKNGVCTQIGNDRFTLFSTTGSKSRLNFLELLNAGDTTHLINDAGLAYMRERNLSGAVIGLLPGHPTKHFADRATWTAHLQALSFTALDVHPDSVRIATEGALWGSIAAQGLLRGTVIISDDAGQFNVGERALCWVHGERLVHKLDAFTADRLAAKEAPRDRDRIWKLYADLRAYARAPTPVAKAELETRFDAIFTSKTGFVMLDRQLKRHHANKADLLVVLDRPDVPLHTNGSENDIRTHVTRRKVVVSKTCERDGGTRSDIGRDAFRGLMKTFAKQAIRFWDYLGARLGVPGATSVPLLPPLIPFRQSNSHPQTGSLTARPFAPVTFGNAKCLIHQGP